MATYNYFITEYDITSTSAVQANTQASLLTPYVKIVQDIELYRLLGGPQYNALYSSVITAQTVDGNITTSAITSANYNLLEKIRPAMVFGCFKYAFPFMVIRITNKGVTVKISPDSSDKPEKEDKDNAKKLIDNIFGEYMTNLKQFLRDNRTTYPLWTEDYFQNYEMDSGSTCSNSTEYDSGLYIPRSGSNYRQRYGW